MPHSEADKGVELHEGSWAYLGLGGSRDDERGLHSRLVEACASNGWPAITWSPSQRLRSGADSARFFEGMSHAVEHADVVVVSVSGSSAMVDAELAFAYRFNRPVVALRIQGAGEPESEVEAMLGSYERAFIVDCADVDQCIGGLHRALDDPRFGEIVRDAAGEPTTYA